MDLRELNELRSTEELVSYQKEVSGRMIELDAEHEGLPFPDDVQAEYRALDEQDKEIDRRVVELEKRKARIDALSRNPDNVDAPDEPDSIQTARAGVARTADIWDLGTVRSTVAHPDRLRTELHGRASRAIELARFPHPDVKREDGQEQIARLLESDSEDGRFARYLLATGSPTYHKAFGKHLAGRMLTTIEQAAMEQAQMAERALSLTGSAGGFAVPFQLDPTIINTSNGVVNPIREIANVESITVDEWRGVSSAGITASYAAEATETTDNAPTLAQPTISTEKAQAFIPFSIEVGQDWPSLQAQMATLLADAKDTLEADKFVNGSGTNEPFGVLTGTTNTVNAAAAGAFTLANLYSLIQALPPRYRPNAKFIGDMIILNKVRQFDTVGSSAAIWQDSLQLDLPGMLLGKAAYEASAMPDVTTVGAKFLLVGDFSRYKIVDRVGLTIELIPHLVGANQRPTGQRGIYAYWRNGAKVVDANAFRALLGQA